MGKRETTTDSLEKEFEAGTGVKYPNCYIQKE
jgi:hypothetical protein